MQRAWLREFNALGLQLRPQAARVVTTYLKEQANPQQAVEELVEQTKSFLQTRRGSVESVIDADVIEAVIELKEQRGKVMEVEGMQNEAIEGDGIQVYDVMTQVRPFDYRRQTKEWVLSINKPTLFPSCDSKAKIYQDRYHLLWQRLLLDGDFIPEAETTDGLIPGKKVLTPVASIVGNPGKKITFGLISRFQQDAFRGWTIEDPHKVMRLSLGVTESSRLVTDGSFVLLEGELKGDIFDVHRLDVPQAVPRIVSMEQDQVPVQVFGGDQTEEQLATLGIVEQEHPEGMYVILSEVHLDKSKVVEKLSVLLHGYEQSTPPEVYVFMGNFCSVPFVPTSEGVKSYRQGFERLKLMLNRLSVHIERGTRFVFVPGPSDPGAQMLPRVPLPNYLTSDLAQHVPNVVMGTNPCRIRHFTRELVFFRHDIMRLVRKHEVVPLRDPHEGAPPLPEHVREEMVRLLLDQAHLLPLPLEESNIMWAFDHTLRLYPLPHAVFIGGVSSHFDCNCHQCDVASVGPFNRDGGFYAYHPVKAQLEQCEIPEQMD